MNNTPTALTCPVCFAPLSVGARIASCPENHSFDRAREGYFNLLLPDQKRSNDPGDDRDSISARREFLTTGHYDFLSATLIQTVTGGNTAAHLIADVGCGEGFFLNRLTESIPLSQGYGLDISKSALRLASRSYKNCQWAVANIARHLPLGDNSCDVLLSNMAPRNADEFKRILKHNGRLIIVAPGDSHLVQLTDHLMDQPSDQTRKSDATTESLSRAFCLLATERIQHTFAADQPTLQRLVTMTPLRWKSKRTTLASLSRLDRLQITASFQILQYAHSTACECIPGDQPSVEERGLIRDRRASRKPEQG